MTRKKKKLGRGAAAAARNRRHFKCLLGLPTASFLAFSKREREKNSTARITLLLVKVIVMQYFEFKIHSSANNIIFDQQNNYVVPYLSGLQS